MDDGHAVKTAMSAKKMPASGVGQQHAMAHASTSTSWGSEAKPASVVQGVGGCFDVVTAADHADFADLVGLVD